MDCGLDVPSHDVHLGTSSGGPLACKPRLDRKFYVLDQYDNTYYGTPANVSLTLRLAF